MKRFRAAAMVSLAVNLYIVAAHVVLRPLHEAGYAQALLGKLIGLSHLMAVGAATIERFISRQSGLYYRPLGLAGVLALNLLIWFAVAWLAIGRRKAAGRTTSQAAAGEAVGGAPDAALEPSRRQLLRDSARLGLAATAAGTAYTLFVEPYRLRINPVTIAIADLPSELQGLRIAHLTDIHHGPWLSLGHVRDVVDQANELGADLVLLTGDYVHRSAAYTEPVAAALGELRAPVGVVAVLGNHDWAEGRGVFMQNELRRRGIRLVDNARLVLTPDRELRPSATEGLCIGGVGDLWYDRQDYDAALGSLPPHMPRLLLSHNPDVAEERRLRQSGHRVDLILCGHTHGGQVRVPGLGTPVIPSRYGQKYASGLVRGPLCQVFISTGVGVALLPIRLGVPPEIALIELRRA